jgi:hypothetical protein
MDIETIEKQLTTETLKLTIASKEDMASATSVLSRLNKYKDALTEEKELLTAPLNQALKEVRSRYKPIETKIDQAVDSIRAEMGRYQTELVQSNQKQEESIASRIGTGKGKLKLDTALDKLANLPEVQQSVNTDEGTIKFRAKVVLKITDRDAIPRAFLIPDEEYILANLKAGQNVEGCELETIQVPVNYR